MTAKPAAPPWPDLPYAAWQDTCTTLHLWTQVIGKIRLAYTPWLNHSWHVTLYTCARGLTTSVIPYEPRPFEIVFDFQRHVLDVATLDGGGLAIPLKPMTVADFYAAVIAVLADLGIDAKIRELPCEIPNAIPFSRDHEEGAYDAEYVNRFWRVLLNVDRVLKAFSHRLSSASAAPCTSSGAASSMAVTRLSGRRAPLHAGGAPGVSDLVMQEAYSHELSSAGFWPGGGGTRLCLRSIPMPTRSPRVFAILWSNRTKPTTTPRSRSSCCLMKLSRTAKNPDATLMAFLQSTSGPLPPARELKSCGPRLSRRATWAPTSAWNRRSLMSALGQKRTS